MRKNISQVRIANDDYLPAVTLGRSILAQRTRIHEQTVTSERRNYCPRGKIFTKLKGCRFFNGSFFRRRYKIYVNLAKASTQGNILQTVYIRKSSLGATC